MHGLVSKATEGSLAVQAVCGTLVNRLGHLKECIHVPDSVRNRAVTDLRERAKKKETRRTGASAAVSAPAPAAGPSHTPARQQNHQCRGGFDPLPKHPRTTGYTASQQPAFFDEAASDGPDQLEFIPDVLELLLSGNTAFRAVGLPRWQAFFKKYLPQYDLLGRKVMQTTHLDHAYEAVIDGWKQSFGSKFARQDHLT